MRGKDEGGEEQLVISKHGRDDRKTGAERRSFVTWEASPEFYREERIGERRGRLGRKERHRKGRLSGLE